MTWTRREAVELGTVLMTAGVVMASNAEARASMYGLISEITTVAGKRDELASLLIGATGKMPGCLSYVVAIDPGKPDTLWITEVWVDKNSHTASLNSPAVQDTIMKGRPLIAGFSSRVETTPIGGSGLQA